MTLTATTKQYPGTRLPHAPADTASPRSLAGARRVRVWDLPTRLFHWSLLACTAALAVTGYLGASAIDWHARLGYATLTLLLFRIVWGFVGGHWSRFRSFLYSPASVMAYLRGKKDASRETGHNPLGAFSVFAMLAVLLAQVATGLVSDDEISFTGPLSHLVTASQSLTATWYHKDVGQWLILALVLLHVAALAFYLIRNKNNLIKSMLDGDKTVRASVPVPASRDDSGSRIAAAAVFTGCAFAVAWLVGLG